MTHTHGSWQRQLVSEASDMRKRGLVRLSALAGCGKTEQGSRSDSDPFTSGFGYVHGQNEFFRSLLARGYVILSVYSYRRAREKAWSVDINRASATSLAATLSLVCRGASRRRRRSAAYSGVTRSALAGGMKHEYADRALVLLAATVQMPGPST